MSEENEFNSNEILQGVAFDPNLIGPTIPLIPQDQQDRYIST
ncbi:exosporium leader peptide-containing protein [Bacillus cereus group sp. MYBK79-1]